MLLKWLLSGVLLCALLTASAATLPPSSLDLEKQLQALNWSQFKAVVKAVPALRSQVDAYGALGWQYVQSRYKTYAWRRNIDKLKPTQKVELAQLIARARNGQARGD